MRFVDRKAVAEPEILHAPFTRGRKKGRSELDDVTDFMARKTAGEVTGSYAFVRYKEDAVTEALEALFFRKCAYCESAYDIVQPVDVEHYRPKGAVDGAEGHPVRRGLRATVDDAGHRRAESRRPELNPLSRGESRREQRFRDFGRFLGLHHGPPCVHRRRAVNSS